MDYTNGMFKSKKDCKHPNKKDLTQGLGKTRNHFCPYCKMHWYLDREWTEAQWEIFVNDFSLLK